jgi:nucleotide-binding universal stress UspA family protein
VVRNDVPAVVVGVDGSTASRAALQWAREEADVHGAPLIAVHVLDPRGQFASYARPPVRHWPSRPGSAEFGELLERWAEGPVEQVFDVGAPAAVLMRHAAGARLLVLGHADHHRLRRGDGHRGTPALGVVARACIAHADCPVVVVPIPAARPAHAAGRRPSEAVEGANAVYPPPRPIPIAHG